MRIVSLLPSATEILCALGLADRLVGISHDCDYPPEILDRPRVTRSRVRSELRSEEIHNQVRESAVQGESLYITDGERLAELAPDLVVTQRQCSVCAVGEADAARALKRAGSRARLLALVASRFAQVPDDIRRLGRAAGCENQADALIEQLNARLERVRRNVQRTERPRVFCLSWFDPLMAAGHWVTEMVELAGGEDGLGVRGQTSTRVEAQALEAYAPEIILLLPCGFSKARVQAEWKAIRRQPLWSKLPAVRAGKVFVVAGSLFHRPGPRLVDGVELLASIFRSERSAMAQEAFVQGRCRCETG